MVVKDVNIIIMSKMNEDEVMNLVFKAIYNAGIQTISAKHGNNQIMFTPDKENAWLMTVAPTQLP